MNIYVKAQFYGYDNNRHVKRAIKYFTSIQDRILASMVYPRAGCCAEFDRNKTPEGILLGLSGIDNPDAARVKTSGLTCPVYDGMLAGERVANGFRIT